MARPEMQPKFGVLNPRNEPLLLLRLALPG